MGDHDEMHADNADASLNRETDLKTLIIFDALL